MNKKELIDQIRIKKSFLSIGLDTDISKIPKFLLEFEDPVFEFNKRIIDSTKDLCVAYKPNIAFYEAMGAKGWESLKKTVDYIPKDIFTIADAKRGDIGNTSKKYAQTFFSTYNFDSITVAPYMGIDSLMPFLNFKNKWTIVLGLTSNQGSNSFQNLALKNGKKVLQEVIKVSSEWGNSENMMYVVGATKANDLKQIRKTLPKHFFLIPGIGAQGGSLKQTFENGANKNIGILINSSRSIIYAGNGKDFLNKSLNIAKEYQSEMEDLLNFFDD